MSQQLVLEPLGLVTEPNKLGQIPAGALSVMTDCVERSPGVIENIKSWQTRMTVANTDAGTTAVFAVPMDNNRVVVILNFSGGWGYRWWDMNSALPIYPFQALSFSVSYGGTLGTYAQSINVSEQPGFSVVRYGQQTFVNLYSGVFVWDDPTGATLASSLVRPAGLQRPQLTQAFNSGSVVGNPLPANSYATYTAINTRMINGRKVVSAPAAAVSCSTVVAGAAVQLVFTLRAGEQAAGDVLEIYRTPSKPSGIASAALTYQAGEEAGAEYKKAGAHTLTASEIASSSFNFFDTVADASLGEALYTNQAIGGAGAAAETPPSAEVLSSYKGYLFGFSTTRAPSITLRPTGTWGGFDSAQTQAVITTGFGAVFGNALNVGASYAAGVTTITVTPTTPLQYLAVGMRARSQGTGFFSGLITSVGASSFTIDTPTTGASGSDTWQAFDTFQWNSSTTTTINSSWPQFLSGTLGSTSGRPDVIGIRAQSLKLAPTTPAPNIVSAVFFPSQPIDGFDFYHRYLQDSRPALGVRASKGLYWDPQLESTVSGTYTFVSEESLPRAFVWSEQDQPEAWPFVNEDSFSRGTVGAVCSTQDAMIAFYTDGIWRVSGTGGTAGTGYDWRADPIANGITVIGSQATCVLLDKPYAMTSEGLIAIEATGIRNITQGRVHDQLSTPPWDNGPYTLATAAFLVEDEEHDEILMREPSATGGKMWIYNTLTDRLSQTTSHEAPFYGFYSRALRSPVIVGRDGSSTWTLKAQTGAYGKFSLTYQNIYADNPFAQRHWQTLNISAETTSATFAPTFNGVAGETRTLDAAGRAGFEVPRNAPAIGNTLQVGLTVTTNVRTKLNGFAIDYRDHTDRRRTR